VFGRTKSAQPLAGWERVAQLAEDQLDEARNLHSLGNWLSRASGLVFILSVLGGIAFMVQERHGTCGNSGGFGSGPCSDTTHPFVIIGISVIAAGIFWAHGSIWIVGSRVLPQP
jgi:hypothetical protein